MRAPRSFALVEDRAHPPHLAALPVGEGPDDASPRESLDRVVDARGGAAHLVERLLDGERGQVDEAFEEPCGRVT
jgi:hypothetical protein